MRGAVSVMSLCSALLQKPTKALLTQKASVELDPHCREGVISLDMTACCQKDCGSCADDSDVCLASATNGRATTCCPSLVVQQATCETSKAPCAVPKYVRETPDISSLTSAEGVPNAADDCGEAIKDTDASILLATHYLEFTHKEVSGEPIHSTVKGSASSTDKCGELGAELTVAAATCDKEDHCMGFTAADGVPDCLIIAGTVVEGYKDSSKDTYLKRMGLAEFTYTFLAPPYANNSCSEECGGGTLNRELKCITSAGTTVPGGMCSHIAWMNKDALPDESIPCNTFDCGPPPEIGIVKVRGMLLDDGDWDGGEDGLCIDKDGVEISGDRAYNCGSGLDRYQISITMTKGFGEDPSYAQFMMESAGGPCQGTYQGVNCEFVPGCYYNMYMGPEVGRYMDSWNGQVYGPYYRSAQFTFGSEDKSSTFWFRKNWGRCIYVTGPGESKVDLSDQNVGEFYKDGEGWKMSNSSIYSSGTYSYYYNYYYEESYPVYKELSRRRSYNYYFFVQIDHKLESANATVKNVSSIGTKAQEELVKERVERAFASVNATKLQRNGKDLRAVMKSMHERCEAIDAGNKAAYDAFKKRTAAKKAKKSKACNNGKGSPKNSVLHLKMK